MKNFLMKLFARKLFQGFFQKMHWVALKGMNYGSANSPWVSGEVKLLEEIKKELPDSPIIFDVGANTGQYARLLLSQFSEMHVVLHMFEPDPKAYAKLVKQFSGNERIFINNFALGEQEGELQLYSENSGAVDATLVRIPGSSRLTQPVKVDTIDNYCRQAGIEKIDFLKIDTEGFEIAVLRGASAMLARNRIKRIQLEHGSLNSVVMGASLYQFNQVLPRFNVFHIKQDGMYPMQYEPRFEIYYNSNYYFEIKSQE